jgi:hypothetical protein
LAGREKNGMNLSGLKENTMDGIGCFTIYCRLNALSLLKAGWSIRAAIWQNSDWGQGCVFGKKFLAIGRQKRRFFLSKESFFPLKKNF